MKDVPSLSPSLLSRLSALRLSSSLLPLLLMAADDASFSSSVRRAIVRGAQKADQLDGIWQQISGEVAPPWQRVAPVSSPQPPLFLDLEFGTAVLTLTLDVGARLTKRPRDALFSQLQQVREQSVLLYGETDGGSAALGTAQRAFPKSLASAVADGYPISNATVFNFEVYILWRLLQDLVPAADRQRFLLDLGNAMLHAPPLTNLELPRFDNSVPRSSRSLKKAVDGCDEILSKLQEAGLFARYTLQLSLGGNDLFDEVDWQAGGSTSWQYIISGSPIVGASQLAQDRTAKTGLGAGLYPGQLITAPIAAYLTSMGVEARIEEYFLDNRVGLPDPRTFADPRYYCDILIEIVTCEA